MDPRKHFSALNIIHKIVREKVQPGDICIDATAGRGNDTLLLSQLVGSEGRVTAFDIQPEAVESTCALLEANGMTDRARVLLKSHSEMDELFEEDTVSCIMFNFGWLPKGNHNIFTNKSTSIPAIEKGLKLRNHDADNLLRARNGLRRTRRFAGVSSDDRQQQVHSY